jgi:electron transfer flavoprotein beta subunit
MDIPQITYAEELLEVNEKSIRIKRRISNGTEVVESPLPVLVTVCGSAPRPRFRHAHLVLQNRHLQIPVWTADDVNPDFERLGLSGSPTKVKKSYTPVRDKHGTIFSKVPAEQAAEKVASMLSEAGII